MTQFPIERYHTQPRMSRIVIHADTIYLCGQVCSDLSAGIALQTEQTLAKIDALLHEVGSSKEKLLTALIHIKTMEDFAQMNAVWDAWVPQGQAPARTCVAAPMANPDYRVEITVTAAR